MRILITGSHGFVGKNLIEVLSSKYDIVRWDVRSDDSLPALDAVIHLAGLAHDIKKVYKPNYYFEVNTELTKKLFVAFQKSNGLKFIYFSSIKAQDNDTPYAKSKKAAEDYIMNTDFPYNTNNTSTNSVTSSVTKKVYILRPCMIHGKGVKGNLNQLVKVLKKGWPWPLAAFENQRSYASIGNVSYIVDELLNKDVPSGIYNICDDDPISTNELVEIIYSNIGKKRKLWRVPKSIIRSFVKIGDILNLPLNSERLRKLTEDYVVDNCDIKHVLGIERLPIAARDGLKQSIQSMI